MGIISVSLTDPTEQRLREYLKSLPGVPPKMSNVIENAILLFLKNHPLETPSQ